MRVHPARANPRDAPERSPARAMPLTAPPMLSDPPATPDTPCAEATMAPMAAPKEPPSMKAMIVLPRHESWRRWGEPVVTAAAGVGGACDDITRVCDRRRTLVTRVSLA